MFMLLVFPSYVYSEELYCFKEEAIKRIVVELEQKRKLEEIVTEYENLVETLRKENELMKKQNELLKEQTQLLEKQKQLYKNAYEETLSKARWTSFFDKIKYTSFGIVSGAILAILLL